MLGLVLRRSRDTTEEIIRPRQRRPPTAAILFKSLVQRQQFERHGLQRLRLVVIGGAIAHGHPPVMAYHARGLLP